MKKVRVPDGVFIALKTSLIEIDSWQELTPSERQIFNISDFIELKIWIRVGNYNLPKELVEKLRKWMVYYMPKQLDEKTKRRLTGEGIHQSDIDWVHGKESSMRQLLPVLIGAAFIVALIIAIIHHR